MKFALLAIVAGCLAAASVAEPPPEPTDCNAKCNLEKVIVFEHNEENLKKLDTIYGCSLSTLYQNGF